MSDTQKNEQSSQDAGQSRIGSSDLLAVGDHVMHDDGSKEGYVVEIDCNSVKVDWGFLTYGWEPIDNLLKIN